MMIAKHPKLGRWPNVNERLLAGRELVPPIWKRFRHSTYFRHSKNPAYTEALGSTSMHKTKLLKLPFQIAVLIILGIPAIALAKSPDSQKQTHESIPIVTGDTHVDKHKEFEEYARHWPEPIRRCGGELIGYFLPTKSAGPTNVALALIEFPSVAAHEQYREALAGDSQARENLARAEQSGCIISEERSFLQRIPGST